MLTLHHLNNSRSQKILWLLEELELPYELVCYQRDPQTLMGPPALKALHPLGKSPVLEEDGKLLSESGAITEYILSRYSKGRLAPDPAEPDHMRFVECMYFAVSAGMNPIMIKVYARAFSLTGAPMDVAATGELETALSYIEELLGDSEWLMGDIFTAADIQMSFIPELASAVGAFEGYAKIAAWQNRLYARPAFHRSIKRGGTYDFASPV
ncbi:glutathione S-transferase family protein [Sphingorhabdus sp.]|jgi:glutathione S-transferase|uniref:glutathione S-transferase family protein n=1 Tax=Sphingorhabdus sp. TaxID=1902408 RepID=UPI00273F82AF|nr:glutathione S-transferase family protein [Sphingorhabdus sp.]MDP4928122.1 glutathione S-transferase family protein [Sphingorhabdus sp.]